MMETTIHVRASEARVRQVIGMIPQAAMGGHGSLDPSRALLVRMALAALDRIHKAFLIKARGGTDDTGLRWPPLSRHTIAYSRKHPGLPSKKKRAAKAPSAMLSKKERDRWWALYERNLLRYGGNRGAAAAGAWRTLKREGARTIMSVHGGTRVEILRDTGVLLSSLMPGAPADTASSSVPRVGEQVFRLGRGEVVVGTRRKWAWTHHEGTDRIPQRRLWPEPSRWTAAWWGAILRQGLAGLMDVTLHLLGRIK